jgi:hypothetical membrane protein
MKKGTNMKFNALSVLFIVIVILIAHILAPEAYDWKRNTISELAAQGYRHKWIMQIGFIGFGVLLSVGVLQNIRQERNYRFRQFPLLIYAIGILLAGIFCTRPFVDGIPYSEVEARLHSSFASIAGFALSAAMLLYFLTDQSRRRILHAISLVLVLGLSITFGLASSYAGIVQRILYLVGFSWLIFIYNSPISSPEEI